MTDTADRQTVDAIADVLRTTEDWNADTLDIIAHLIGQVRRHPGGHVSGHPYSYLYRPAGRAAAPGDWQICKDGQVFCLAAEEIDAVLLVNEMNKLAKRAE